jgi:3-oxoacyl-[acyl-carrier protein] reductase
MDFGLRDKTAFVTGSSRGIGRAIAEMLSGEGVNVAVCARNPEETDAAVKAIGERGGRAWGRALDVADRTALEQWIDDGVRELGGLDILVCNASSLASGYTPEAWERSFNIDIMHTVNAINRAIPHLERSSAGSIVITSSVSGLEVGLGAGSYGAAKAALIHYVKGLSRELAGKGIRVNAVSPGNTYFEGGFWQRIERDMPDAYKSAMAANPTGRMGTPEEIAHGAVFLASPLASRISGANLIIDGALTKAV